MRYTATARILFRRSQTAPLTLVHPKESVSCSFFLWMRQRNKPTLPSLYPEDGTGRLLISNTGLEYNMRVIKLSKEHYKGPCVCVNGRCEGSVFIGLGSKTSGDCSIQVHAPPPSEKSSTATSPRSKSGCPQKRKIQLGPGNPATGSSSSAKSSLGEPGAKRLYDTSEQATTHGGGSTTSKNHLSSNPAASNKVGAVCVRWQWMPFFQHDLISWLPFGSWCRNVSRHSPEQQPNFLRRAVKG